MGALDDAAKVARKGPETGIVGMYKEGQERAARLYDAVEHLIPVFERWEKVAAEQTEAMNKMAAAIEKLAEKTG